MTAKTPTPVDYRMSAADFDGMMRGALSAPSPVPKEAKRAAPAKKRAHTKKRAK
jgi:hypothetical protein